MPIYEFRCLKCHDCFELLLLSRDETIETKCPHCGADDFEKIISVANHAVGGSPGSEATGSAQTRTCSGGSCTTYNIPGVQ